ncbi:winged helix-turn-helix transcriptional regulator [Streptomyces sp. NPDC002574]|uniref:winged helix-turn-helix transcriptional regulator n=1 Tax=Streptomyces sp. NPDC002574 TaxID=3364652 RepID=UPI0036A8A926
MSGVPEPAGPDGPCREVDATLARVFGLFGKRWTGLVLAVLTESPTYYAQLRRAVPGISERMLSERLTELADAGLVVRDVDPGPPLRVRYEVTEAGAALRPALSALARWADEHYPGT